LEDGRLKICVDNDEGKARPTEFATKPGSGLTLMVLEREAVEDKGRAPAPPGDKARLTLESGSSVHAVAFSPDGKSLWTCSEDGRALLWDVATGKARTVYKFWGNRCLAMVMSPNGQFLAIGGTDAVPRNEADSSKREGGGFVVYDVSSGKDVWGQAAP